MSSEAVVELKDFPQSSVGAPCPAIVATERALCVIFYAEPLEPGWDGKTTRMVDPESADEPVVLVRFERPSAHLFGPPSDEIFSGHRLSSKGLEPYGAFEVLNSDWIRQLEEMNSVHPYHDKARYVEGKRHFILTFHDSTFECVARGFEVEFPSGSLKQVAQACAGDA